MTTTLTANVHINRDTAPEISVYPVGAFGCGIQSSVRLGDLTVIFGASDFTVAEMVVKAREIAATFLNVAAQLDGDCDVDEPSEPSEADYADYYAQVEDERGYYGDYRI